MHSLLFALLGSLCLRLAGQIVKHRKYYHGRRLFAPLIALARGVWLKGALAAFVVEAGFWASALSLLSDVFEIRASAAFALAMVLTFDFLSGVYASWWRKSDKLGRPAQIGEFFQSRRLRDSVVKVGEYVAVLVLFTVAANVWTVEVGWAKQWTYVFIFFTEVWSTRENFQHIPMRSLLVSLRKKWQGKFANPPTPKQNKSQDGQEAPH